MYIRKNCKRADPCDLPNFHYIYLWSLLYLIRHTLFVTAKKECKGQLFILMTNFQISDVKFSNQKAGPPLPIPLELPYLPQFIVCDYNGLLEYFWSSNKASEIITRRRQGHRLRRWAKLFQPCWRTAHTSPPRWRQTCAGTWTTPCHEQPQQSLSCPPVK